MRRPPWQEAELIIIIMIIILIVIIIFITIMIVMILLIVVIVLMMMIRGSARGHRLGDVGIQMAGYSLQNPCPLWVKIPRLPQLEDNILLMTTFQS